MPTDAAQAVTVRIAAPPDEDGLADNVVFGNETPVS